MKNTNFTLLLYINANNVIIKISKFTKSSVVNKIK
jgi:hypothetical protein